MKQIVYYSKPNWEIPIKFFLDEIKMTNIKLFDKIIFKIDLLSEESLWQQDVKYIWNKLYELRIKQSTNISRVFYFTYTNNYIILLDWILKKNNKLKISLIEKLKIYMNDFLKNIWKI